MKNRPTKTIKLEIYEDQTQEFMGLLWLLKSALKNEEFSFEMIRNYYEDPSIFDNVSKDYLYFIKKFVEMVFIQSVDGENPTPSVDVFHVGNYPVIKNGHISNSQNNIFPQIDFDPDFDGDLEEVVVVNLNEMNDPKQNGTPLESETKDFIERSTVLPKIFNQDNLQLLIQFIDYQINNRKITVYQRDKFRDAAIRYTNKSRTIASDIDHLIHNPFLFKYSSNVIFQKRSIHSPRKCTVKKNIVWLVTFTSTLNSFSRA